MHSQSLPTTTDAKALGPVVFLCPVHLGIRNMVHTGVARLLRQHGIRSHLLIGTPETMENYLPAFRNTKVNPLEHQDYDGVEGWSVLTAPPLVRQQRGAATLGAIQRASFFRRYHLNNDRVTRWWYFRNVSLWEKIRNQAAQALSIVGSHDPFFGWQNEALQHSKYQQWNFEQAREQLKQLRPSLVVATSCVIWAEEAYIMAARDLGIPTLGCIQSFDALTSRPQIAPCDDFSVWNQRMQNQLLTFHPQVAKSRVHITGAPQFDFHGRDEFRWTREETLTRLGLPPGTRYVLYAANSFHQTPTEADLIAEFAQRCKRSLKLCNHMIVTRLHPQDNYQRWAGKLMNAPNLVVSQPTTRSWHFSKAEEQALLVNSLRYADVCLNMWSTMSLDAAAVGTPAVCVGFALEAGSKEDRFCHMAYETDFYAPIIESGGVRLAQNMDQLVTEVTAYVADRTRDQHQREKLAATDCGLVDGKTAERIAGLITRLVHVDIRPSAASNALPPIVQTASLEMNSAR